MKRRNRNHRRIVVQGPVPPPPPAGFNSWDEVRDAIWNAGLRHPGTRAFKIVGDELHEISIDEAVVGGDEEVNDA